MNVSGEHIFENLYATNISIPLNIATQDTIVQMLRITEARAKEFNLVKDEFFLPLNGPAVTMTGSITAAKVKVTGLVELRGQIAGKSAKKLMPLTDIYTPLNLSYNCYLQNVTFSNFVKAQDIVSPSRSSLKRILENSVPLDSDVPKHVMLISDKIVRDSGEHTAIIRIYVTAYLEFTSHIPRFAAMGQCDYIGVQELGDEEFDRRHNYFRCQTREQQCRPDKRYLRKSPHSEVRTSLFSEREIYAHRIRNVDSVKKKRSLFQVDRSRMYY